MRQVTHALLTRPPLDRISASTNLLSFDLHVLSTPPAFILSQDQTLIKNLSRVQIWLWSLSIPFTVLGLYQTCVCYVLFEILYLEFQGCHVVNFSRFFVVELISDNFYMLSHSVFFVNNFFNFFFDVLHVFQMRSSWNHLSLFVAVLNSNSGILTHIVNVCQQLFSIIFNLFCCSSCSRDQQVILY